MGGDISTSFFVIGSPLALYIVVKIMKKIQVLLTKNRVAKHFHHYDIKLDILLFAWGYFNKHANND